jgi:hypothetical protein
MHRLNSPQPLLQMLRCKKLLPGYPERIGSQREFQLNGISAYNYPGRIQIGPMKTIFGKLGPVPVPGVYVL